MISSLTQLQLKLDGYAVVQKVGTLLHPFWDLGPHVQGTNSPHDVVLSSEHSDSTVWSANRTAWLTETCYRLIFVHLISLIISLRIAALMLPLPPDAAIKEKTQNVWTDPT